MTTPDMIALSAAVTGSIAALIAFAGVVIARAANAINRNNSREQLAMEERKLFLELMPRRAEWYDRVKLALDGRAKERHDQITMILEGQSPTTPVNLAKLWQLETEAAWLFDRDMVALMGQLIAMDKYLNDRLLTARQGDHQAARDSTTLSEDLYACHGQLQEYLASYLYVGDIGKPKKSPITFVGGAAK